MSYKIKQNFKNILDKKPLISKETYDTGSSLPIVSKKTVSEQNKKHSHGFICCTMNKSLPNEL